ncbi:MAG TPA: tRNA (adenosine(37)-N6)-threonylcarbamoyltransferase complex ATPase subunit type 1 TsaE [Opitutaceae bacterium]|jgi:tRNA threonylcarbamoyladenosine biosynthesis protein TsaE|nr:tRNA (adenosine(37)-N6)-threonylcarbamoyltransferase complex ATPase subunit type 1 TsaE [Opitutaceae bacterium]
MNIFEKLRAGIATASAEETRSLAAELAAALPPDTTLALHGDLGAGKTTFVQGLAHGFGIVEPVTSPTFTIFTLHRRTAGTLVHLDAYRLDDPRQIEALMLDDFLVSPWCLAVEWPEKIAAWLPDNAIHLALGIADDGRHTIRLK